MTKANWYFSLRNGKQLDDQELLFKVQCQVETAGSQHAERHGGSQPEVEEEMADDMEALEFETAMQNFPQVVYNDLKIPEHPIEVNQFNICKLM